MDYLTKFKELEESAMKTKKILKETEGRLRKGSVPTPKLILTCPEASIVNRFYQNPLHAYIRMLVSTTERLLVASRMKFVMPLVRALLLSF